MNSLSIPFGSIPKAVGQNEVSPLRELFADDLRGFAARYGSEAYDA